jgi:hypothetical protein
MDGVRLRTFQGNAHVCNVWFNGRERKANANWIENVRNANDWVAFLRESLCSIAPIFGAFGF